MVIPKVLQMSEQEKTSLIPCPDCGNSCSTAALSCPRCGRPLQQAPPSGVHALGDTIYTHISTQSSVKVGVCLTLLGLLKVVEGLKGVSTIGDEFLAVDAIIFLISGLLSYFALKQERQRRKYVLGRAADGLFITALCLLVIICCSIVYELS
jgi:hypothetical protein